MSDYILKNYMEDCVIEALPKVLDTMTICRCEQCRMDIIAYALNQLPPKYLATRKGHLYARVDSMRTQFGADIVTAVSKGAKLVGENPRHE